MARVGLLPRALWPVLGAADRLLGAAGKRPWPSPPAGRPPAGARPGPWAVWSQGPGGGLGPGRPVLLVPRRAAATEGRDPRGPLPTTPLTPAQQVKEAGRDFTYLIVVLVGISVTGGLFYVIFKELFSSSSPSKIYGDALEKCRAHPEVIGVFGEPIKGYGETTRRGRRQHVSHVEYVKDGTKRMRLKFYIEGSEPGKQGTVHLEMKENLESGKYEYRYIFVDVDAYPRRTIIIEDNR
ncbi:mitochondrial import inner membrane translocase subunit Tim21 [Ornithorhynchus anatinus]|uniref:mitochondrial import inner membrane translocase subunit Tim21 n=1 Tax=Ornithorhynchus anatinus TaxID=9258 RepID=UPI0010A90873|nr:mitochondrial import inner membrane translocase subunit Tim21 [Ornithorhynchus anatinus]